MTLPTEAKNSSVNGAIDHVAVPNVTTSARYAHLESYAEQDALLGSPNPRYKQSSVYCNKYLDVRIQMVGTEGLTDDEWDLTIF